MDDLQTKCFHFRFQSLPAEVRKIIYVWCFFPLTSPIPGSKLRTIWLDPYDVSLPLICWVSKSIQVEAYRVLAHSYIPRVWDFEPLERLPKSFKANIKRMAMTVHLALEKARQTSKGRDLEWIGPIDGQDARSRFEQLRAQLPVMEYLDLTIHFGKPVVAEDSYRGIASSLARILEPLLSLKSRTITFFNHCGSYVDRESRLLEVELEKTHSVQLIEGTKE